MPLIRRLLAALLLTAGSLDVAQAREQTLSATRPGRPALRVTTALRGDAWVVVVREGGAQRQRFLVRTDAPHAAPGLGDADGDGAADLWIPIITGNANTQYAIWRMRPAEGRFAEAGEVSGLHFAREEGGYLVATGRNGCCGVSHEFFRFDAAGRLQPAFTIERRFMSREDRPDSFTVECGTAPENANAPAALAERYCGLQPGAPLPGQPIR